MQLKADASLKNTSPTEPQDAYPPEQKGPESQRVRNGRGVMASRERERPRLRKPDTHARQSYPPRRFEKYAWINRVLGYKRRLAWLDAK